MSNPYINVYMNNPTAGDTDGTAISTGGDQTSPLVITLDASTNETKKEKLGIRCEAGYATTGDTTIQDNNDTADRWKFGLTENGTFTDTLVIASTIDTVNTIFYAQASSDSLETPTRDTSVSMRVNTVIQATA